MDAVRQAADLVLEVAAVEGRGVHHSRIAVAGDVQRIGVVGTLAGVGTAEQRVAAVHVKGVSEQIACEQPPEEVELGAYRTEGLFVA